MIGKPSLLSNTRVPGPDRTTSKQVNFKLLINKHLTRYNRGMIAIQLKVRPRAMNHFVIANATSSVYEPVNHERPVRLSAVRTFNRSNLLG
jgi:hypothetical protein